MTVDGQMLAQHKSPKILPGIHPRILDRAREYLANYGYPEDAPLSCAVDDTKLLLSLRPYYDSAKDKWFLVGNTGEPMEVIDVDLLHEQIKQAGDLLATKLRLWTLNIPLPHVPPLILAVQALTDKNNAVELATTERRVLEILIVEPANPLNIVSLGSDGTIVERNARKELVRQGFATEIERRIPHPIANSPPIVVTLLQIGTRILVIVQDSKHCRKTCRNNIFSGARLLLLGRFPIYYELVRTMVLDRANSPLFVRDVDKLDRQDDRAAARLFSAANLKHAIGTSNTGLAVYIFVFGELADAVQSRTITHAERIKMALRAAFFKSIWKTFLTESDYPLSRYYISQDADDIIDIVVNGLLGLIYTHRDYLPAKSFPLQPWSHGTETNEHVFGLLRQNVPDFTVLDALRIIPKVEVQLSAACKRSASVDNLHQSAAGYSHTYFDSDSSRIDIKRLATFPDDEEIAHAAKIAHEEARNLWEILGYYCPDEAEGSSVRGPQDIPNLESDEDNDIEDLDQPSDRQLLEDAFRVVCDSYAKQFPSSHTDKMLDECGFTAAALDLNELGNLDSLPEEDPGAVEAIRLNLSDVLSKIAAYSNTEALSDSLLHATQAAPSAASSSSVTSAADDLNSQTVTAYNAPTLDLNALLLIRERTESAESKRSCRVPSASRCEPEASTASPSLSERRLLADKIHSIIKAEQVDKGTSTGLNRQTRWESSSGTATLGNAANAQAAARSSARNAVKARQTAFAALQHIPLDLPTAGINLIPLVNGVYAIISINSKLMIGQGKGGGKAAKHNWTPEANTIGAVSYLIMQVWEQMPGRPMIFRSNWHKATSHLELPRFMHLHAIHFIYWLPCRAAIMKVSDDRLKIELTSHGFERIYKPLFDAKPLISAAIARLSVRKSQTTTED
ncbi:hypothetical protein EYR38_003485 [Pleurotus pulmonarius]|nr:hypothetical protein EYR38_003485 [Pleurotus pulmonarius]